MDVNMASWSIFLNITLRTAVRLGQDQEANPRYVKNHLWNSVGQFFNESEKPIGEREELTGVSTVKFKDCKWMSTSLLCSGPIKSPTPKPTSSPTLCSVWWRWEMILLRLGRAKINGIRKTITSRIWFESIACRRSSSGKYSKESQRWASWRRFKVQWETYSVNVSTSQTGSPSCQCTTTLNGEQKETKKDVKTFHRQLRIMLANSLAVIDLSCAWIRREVVRNLRWQTWRIMGSNCTEYDRKIVRIGSSSISCLQGLRERRVTK